MKMNLTTGVLMMMGFIINTAFAQDAQKLYTEWSKNNSVIDKPLDKKFRWGITFSHYWTSIKGNDLPKEYYFKPCIGGAVRAEYYFKPFIGLAAGVGFQQGGAGVINEDKSGGAFAHPWIVDKNGNRGDVDSTYLEKLRFSSIEIPLSIIFKTPKGGNDFRLSGGAGLVFIRNFKQNEAWLDVVGGLHDYNFVDTFVKNHLAYQFALGADISAGDQGIFQVHFVFQRGMKNVYSAGQGSGNEVRCGIRFAYLF